MPGDLVISDSAVDDAPKDYVVPAAQRFVVKQVQALYTDNGAGGDWLPALEIVSDAGIVTGRYVGSSVGAGSDQEVTWAPFLRGAQAAASSVFFPAGFAYLDSGVSVPDATVFDLTQATDAAQSGGGGFDLTPGAYQVTSPGWLVLNAHAHYDAFAGTRFHSLTFTAASGSTRYPIFDTSRQDTSSGDDLGLTAQLPIDAADLPVSIGWLTEQTSGAPQVLLTTAFSVLLINVALT